MMFRIRILPLAKCIFHQFISGSVNKGIGLFKRLVKIPGCHVILNKQHPAGSLVFFTIVNLIWDMPYGIFQIFNHLLDNHFHLCGTKVEFRSCDFFRQEGDITKLENQMIVTPGTLEISTG